MTKRKEGVLSLLLPLAIFSVPNRFVVRMIQLMKNRWTGPKDVCKIHCDMGHWHLPTIPEYNAELVQTAVDHHTYKLKDRFANLKT